MQKRGIKLAEVAVNLPIQKTFYYLIPEKLKEKLRIGMHVRVPFKNKIIDGYVINITGKKVDMKLKEISKIIDPEFALDKKMIEFGKKISTHYFCSLGEVLSMTVPKKISKKILDKTNEIIKIEKNKVQLNNTQKEIIEKIKNAINKNKFEVILLHGIDEKIEIYIEISEYVIKNGKLILILVPEISLTPEIIERFKIRFGSLVNVWHSRLKISEKTNIWNRLQTGKIKVLIGVRAAVFLPLPNLGAIIIDEEHDISYKQVDRPKYHAREVAIIRAEYEKFPIILCSATPSLESYYAGKIHKYKLFILNKKEKREIPKISLVDMRGERKILSTKLIESIENKLNKNEQVILFLNRRGFSTSIICKECGYVYKCKRCDIPLVMHIVERSMICHYCAYKMEIPTFCEVCHGFKLMQLGAGTQKVESEIKFLFPKARVQRFDKDAIKRYNEYLQIMKQLENKEIDILVGTRMILKGLHFSNVTLVGIIFADALLHLPDFRASELTYQFLMEVLGCATRKDIPMEVIIQTYNPSHYSISMSVNYEEEKFYETELKYRNLLKYPPFMDIIRVIFIGKNEINVRKIAYEYTEKLKNIAKEVEILGPTKPIIQKIKNEFRYHTILKSDRIGNIKDAIRKVGLYDLFTKEGVRIIIDVNPMNLL
jgi:primosomal protein N' (replication factor Y)